MLFFEVLLSGQHCFSRKLLEDFIEAPYSISQAGVCLILDWRSFNSAQVVDSMSIEDLSVLTLTEIDSLKVGEPPRSAPSKRLLIFTSAPLVIYLGG